MKIFIVLIILSSVCLLMAGTVSGSNNLGFTAGELTRNGISYRHWGEKWGYQITAMIKAQEDKVPAYFDYTEGDYPDSDFFGYGKDLRTNFGISILNVLQRTDNRRFYAFAGYGFYHKEQKVWQSENSDMHNAWAIGYKVKNDHFWGIGAGFDIEILDYLRVFLEMPITFKSNYEITMYIPQIGIFYSF